MKLRPTIEELIQGAERSAEALSEALQALSDAHWGPGPDPIAPIVSASPNTVQRLRAILTKTQKPITEIENTMSNRL